MKINLKMRMQYIELIVNSQHLNNIFFKNMHKLENLYYFCTEITTIKFLQITIQLVNI